MSTQREVIDDLEASGALAGVRWAYRSATTRTLESYSEADGHDAALLGNLRFTLLRDRLDRVFACGRYGLLPGSDASASLDLLHAELTQRDIKSLPTLPRGLVSRSNLNGSPGWVHQKRRFLLASCAVGGLDSLPWPQKSPTKQRVARQPNHDPEQASLFDDDEFGGLVVLLNQAQLLDLDTYVVGHTLDPVSHTGELVFGSPRLNSGGGNAWYWYEDLLTSSPVGGGRRADDAPTPTGPDAVPDAPVRLRRSAEKRDGEQATGT